MKIRTMSRDVLTRSREEKAQRSNPRSSSERGPTSLQPQGGFFLSIIFHWFILSQLQDQHLFQCQAYLISRNGSFMAKIAPTTWRSISVYGVIKIVVKVCSTQHSIVRQLVVVRLPVLAMRRVWVQLGFMLQRSAICLPR